MSKRIVITPFIADMLIAGVSVGITAGVLAIGVTRFLGFWTGFMVLVCMIVVGFKGEIFDRYNYQDAVRQLQKRGNRVFILTAVLVALGMEGFFFWLLTGH